MLKAMLQNNPFGIAREMDRLFDSMLSSQPLGTVPSLRTHRVFPAINLWEDDERLYAEAELPGMTLQDVEVLVTDDELTVKGSRSFEAPGQARPLRRERAMGTFERTIGLPMTVDGDKVEATLCNGVLSITLPKAVEARPRKITVTALPTGS